MTQRPQKQQRPAPWPKLVFETLLFLYLAVGLYGSMWISVDFAGANLNMMVFVGLPLAIVYYAFQTLSYGWECRHRILYGALVATLMAVFSLGHILLVNHWTSHGEVVRDRLKNGQVRTVAEHRGGLGLLYIKRW